MEPEYNAEEIETAAKKLKNNKAAGRDEVSVELIKYGCRELYQQVASLLNATSEKGDYSEEIRRGILTPLAKLPKKVEQVNVRAIILISTTKNHHYNTDWLMLRADDKSYTSKSSSTPER